MKYYVMIFLISLLEDIVSKDILDSIHMANINYPTEGTIIEQLFISNKIIQI